MHPNAFTDPNEKQDFRGNFLTSLYGIQLIVMVALLSFFSYDLGKEHRGLQISGVLLLVAVLWYLGLGLTLFYFRLSADYLEIKSHVYPGFRKQYRLEDISRVSFERSTGRVPSGLRIKMKTGSRSLNWLAGSLRKRHWEALAQALEERGIPVDSPNGLR